jgi:cell migration-inducing and hyaluronan-binding protein
MPNKVVVTTMALMFALLTMSTSALAEDKVCGMSGPETLKPFGDEMHYKNSLLVVGVCNVTTDPDQMGPLKYYFQNVNILKGGVLKFNDAYDIDFYAESILVESGGTLTAVSTQMGYEGNTSRLAGVLPFQKRLTIHLWGPATDPGIECQTKTTAAIGPCGIPNPVWLSNPEMSQALMMSPPPPPKQPKNQPCNPIASPYLVAGDCFYQYEVQDKADKQAGLKAYFGHKVLAVSFGGSLQLFGAHGVSYLMQGQQCLPAKAGNECNPAFTGKSWVRLTSLSSDKKTLIVNNAVDWKQNDVIVVTSTDYLPSHSEEATVDSVSDDGKTITLKSALANDHNASTFSFSSAPNGEKNTYPVGPFNDPNLPELNRAIDTRAAVALLTRNIQIVSEGDTPSNAFTETPDNYYGGHTIVREGFASFQVQGVEFYQLGQGGQKGRYPVHFHMVRKVPQPATHPGDPTPEPINYLKDCSIHDSMTRWVTLHATEGMYLARNVGEKSIGHGYYLEDATEVNNKLYSNIGILARAAIQDTVHNPRQVPGILADDSARDPDHHNDDYMPYRSDYNHPTIFWITNGWNDFQYNFAASAATCGACYWWLPAANSGPSQYQTFGGYASQQIVTGPCPLPGCKDDQNKIFTNYGRAGLAPLENFVGNSCVAAMSSFQMNGQTAECTGVEGGGTGDLQAVHNPFGIPSGPDGEKLPMQPFQTYYPVVSELHNPSICTAANCSDNSANQNNPPCDGNDSHLNCTVTKLDHYTTSFNFAQTNFSAVWLRKGWDLFVNGAVTDTLQGGLNFITGGGYTRSDVALGEWLVARNSVFVGHTQDGVKNPYALDVGPFNPDSGLSCTNSDANHCEYADGGVSFNLPDFPAQKLLNIYDGPSHQDSNAFMNINKATVECTPTNGTCTKTGVPLVKNNGVLQDKTETDASCYLPNAAIGWKQPNGFYYPPAFHSKNLWFSNVDIRHFVIEPLFKPILPTDDDPFQQDNDGPRGVHWRYCTYTDVMFQKNFNHIDRQTVLNDDDGTLTGLLGSDTSQGQPARPSISINEDPYFNTPLSTPECLSDLDITPPPLNPPDLPYTATTSPYEWLSTAMISDCVGNGCYNPTDMYLHWTAPCGNSFCRGVPLYREYLTDSEFTAGTRPQIRMMGQGTGQRSTLSLNHASYYIDTEQTCASQGGNNLFPTGCPKCTEPSGATCAKTDGNPFSPSTFVGGHTYYLYLLYATATTKQHYDIYVGVGAKQADLKVTQWWINPNNYNEKFTPSGGSYVTADYSKLQTTGVLGIDMDLTGQGSIFSGTKKSFCTPATYCKASDDGQSCGCKNSNNCSPRDCAWAINDVDCPVDAVRGDHPMHCYGFSFTMPANFTPTRILPPDNLFKKYSEVDYFNSGKVKYTNPTTQYAGDVCKYSTLPQ